MAQLRIANIKLSEEFNAAFSALGIEMPLAVELECPTEIYDGSGRTVLLLQAPSCSQTEQMTAYQIASLIVLAVNTCGSFKAEITNEPEAPRQ